MSTPPILRVGLTGNIAAGKTTVARWLAESGCLVLELDALGHDCLEPGEPTHSEIIEAFGDTIVGTAGAIDRTKLGEMVFADGEARARLEAILHPRIRQREQREIERWTAEAGAGIAVTEAALFYETGSADRYHRMVVVVARDDVRLARLVADGLQEEQARRRMAAQIDQRQKAAAADYVIDNGGDLEATRAQVDRLIERLRGDLETLASGQSLPAAESL